MNSLSIPYPPTRPAGDQLASLGARHGYRFDADTVHLHAMFAVHTPAAHDRAWTLQLWACPAAPASGAEVRGHLVAQTALPPIGELADDTHAFEVSTFAQPPAGWAEYVMVMALTADGEIHDRCAYPHREGFFAPSLSGVASYRIAGDRVELAVDRIENPRSADNLSGTLALALWALPTRYEGGDFQGVPLSGVAFDTLPGQWEYLPLAFDLPFTAPPAGRWQLVVKLREWTAAAYVTRDYVNFDAPYIQPAPVAAPVVAPAPAPLVEPAPVAAPAPKAPAAKATVTRSAAPARGVDLASALKSGGVSVNAASLEDLAQVKGLTRKVAEAVIKGRPYRSLDDLIHVKGMGPKLLSKIAPGLKL